MLEILEWIVREFPMNHQVCYLKQPITIWSHVLSDITIFIAYIMIPFELRFLRSKIEAWPIIHRFMHYFMMFIFLCALTHAFAIVTVFFGFYNIAAIIKAVTAVVSIATALLLIPARRVIENLLEQ